MAVTCLDVMNLIEKVAPPQLVMSWDNIGLQVGHPLKEIDSLLITLDITHEVVEEAISMGADMIVAHHPLIFKPLQKIRFDTPVGKLLAKLIESHIQVYIAHTNLDRAEQGTNYYLAKALGLKDTRVLEAGGNKLYKIAVFVPEGYEDSVRNAMGEAGAGWIGNYSHCTFQVEGTGTFRPLPGSDPFIGSVEELEKVQEYRLETIVPENLKSQVLKAMIKAHPYEEVAFDIYPLENQQLTTGLGRIGDLESPMTLSAFADKVKDCLDIQYVNVVGSPTSEVSRVAFCGGAGGNLILQAKMCSADVYLTGDIKYHEALEAGELGINLVDAGHNATEKFLAPALVNYLKGELKEKRVSIFTSQINTDPWTLV
jgi:dinuclear metal center YbgI/SA1388 family protein